MGTLIALVLGISVFGLLFAGWLVRWVLGKSTGSEKMQAISNAIKEGAEAFLRRQNRTILFLAVLFAAILFVGYGFVRSHHDFDPVGSSLQLATWITLSFILGALCSVFAGYVGMWVSIRSNIRTATAALTSLNDALRIALRGGAVSGLLVVAMSLLGVAGLYALVNAVGGVEPTKIPLLIVGYGFGASFVALFAQLGGGIYTKAADVGADLVGKIEAGIPEDDPRNPAVIADNVGDNVGDVAGMGADLFESYIGAIVSAMVIGATVLATGGGEVMKLIMLPLVVAGVGILCSIAGTFFVKTKEGSNPQVALNAGALGAAAVMAVLTYFLVQRIAPPTFTLNQFTANMILEPVTYSRIGIFWATVVGLLAGVIIGFLAEYYTAEGKGPSNRIADRSLTGPATNIIAGLGNGMLSTGLTSLMLGAAIVLAFKYAGIYGIAMGGLGMLATVGIQLAVDAYGPIADNAGGCAEMAHLEPEVRKRTDKLDAVGNTTAAIGKGFAIGSAALTALALFTAFAETVGLRAIDVSRPDVMAGLLVGAMMPFLFSAFAMNAVGEAAYAMVEEVRRQFKEIPGLLQGQPGARADYARCVDISAASAIKRMMVPALLGVLVPVITGFVFGKDMLGGLLAGVTVSGVMMAVFMANAGGAWDNAKKHIEAGAHGGKGSAAHKAAVVGDTVGDPFKDTAGPSLNILMKLMSVVSLVIAPILKVATPLLK